MKYKVKNLIVIFGVMLFATVALAAIKAYTGIGKGTQSELVNQQQAMSYASERAEQNAKDQAGVYLASYTRTNGRKLAKDEITAITGEILDIVGEVQYKPEPSKVEGIDVIVYTATLTANIDTDGIEKWFSQDANQQKESIKETLQTNKEIERVSEILCKSDC